jgi:hypothetical protein
MATKKTNVTPERQAQIDAANRAIASRPSSSTDQAARAKADIASGQQLIQEVSNKVAAGTATEEEMSNASIALSNIQKDTAIQQSSMTASQLAANGLMRDATGNIVPLANQPKSVTSQIAQVGQMASQPPSEASVDTGVQGELSFTNWAKANPGGTYAEWKASKGGMANTVTAQYNTWRQEADALTGQPKTAIGFDIFAKEKGLAEPVQPGENASPGAQAAYARAMAVYSENTKMADERNKAIEARLGMQYNLGAELEKLKSQNANLSAIVGDKVAIPGIDDRLKELEEQYGLAIDKTSPEVLAKLGEIAALPKEEQAFAINNLALKFGQPIENLAKLTPKASITEPKTAGGTPTTPTVNQDVSGASTTATVSPTGATTNQTTGITEWTDPVSNVTYTSTPKGTLDLTKLTPEQMNNLSGMDILRAELQMGLAFQDDDNKIDDNFYKNITKAIMDSKSHSETAISAITAIQSESARLEEQKNLDEIEYQRNINAIDKQESFDNIAEEEAKTEGYFKGKLAAYGAEDSSAALAIQSANALKFAKLKATTGAKFSAEENRLMKLNTYARAAYTNSLVEITTRANADLVSLNDKTTEALLNVLNSKLKGDNQKDKERWDLQMGFVKGVKDLESAKLKAEADAAKEAHDYFKDQVTFAHYMSGDSGWVYDVDSDGNIFNTGKETLARELGFAKLAAARKAGGGSFQSKDVINWIDQARAAGKSDTEINKAIENQWPANSTAENNATRNAREYMNQTTIVMEPIPLPSGVEGPLQQRKTFYMPPAPTTSNIFLGNLTSTGQNVNTANTDTPKIPTLSEMAGKS